MWTVGSNGVKGVHVLAPAVVIACSCMSASCRVAGTEGRSPSYLIVERLEAASGADPNDFADVLQSDVSTCDRDGANCSIYEDRGRVTLRLALRDIGTPDAPSAPTPTNFVTIDHYHVAFRRSDGRNQPGVDVPHAFDGGVTFTVTDTGTTPGVVTLVRAQAKLEPPLIAMTNRGGAIVISMIAEVTFFGRDQVGHAVTATATISVHFSDWADPQV